MLKWLETNSSALQTLAALFTAALALLAIIGVKLQIDASYGSQREQSARDIYREFLNISVANPDFADPVYCALRASPKAAAYEAYVEYMLYAAEQAIDLDSDARAAFTDNFTQHAPAICEMGALIGFSDAAIKAVTEFRAQNCHKVLKC